ILVAGGATSADRISAALSELGRRGVTSLFLEGGLTLAKSFAEADQLDESRIFIAPRAGGAGAGVPRGAEDAEHPSTVGEAAATGPARRSALSTETEPVGEDELTTTRFKEW